MPAQALGSLLYLEKKANHHSLDWLVLTAVQILPLQIDDWCKVFTHVYVQKVVTCSTVC